MYRLYRNLIFLGILSISMPLHHSFASGIPLKDSLGESGEILKRVNNLDHPECLEPIGYYKTVAKEVIVHFKSNADEDLFYYEVTVKTDGPESVIIQELRQGKKLNVNLNQKEVLEVSCRRVCYRDGYTKNFYSDWVTFDNLQNPDTSSSQSLCAGINDRIEISRTDTGSYRLMTPNSSHRFPEWGNSIRLRIVYCDGETEVIYLTVTDPDEGWELIKSFDKGVCGVYYDVPYERIWNATTNSWQYSYCTYTVFSNLWYGSTNGMTLQSAVHQLGVIDNTGTNNHNGTNPYSFTDENGNPINNGNGGGSGGGSGGGGGNDNSEFSQLANKCGDDFTPDTITNLNELSKNTLKIGDSLDIYGYHAIVIEEDDINPKAALRLPFGNQRIAIGLSGLSINTDYKVFAGEIEMSANGGPYTQGNSLVSAEEYCRIYEEDTTSVQYNGYGFDSNGDYKYPPYPGYVEGDPFDPKRDPCGFDSAGIHVLTGTEFNPEGCSRNEIDTLGGSCNPCDKTEYYWLKNGENTKEGEDFFQNNKDSIFNVQDTVISDLFNAYQSKVVNQKNLCDNIRSEINSNVFVTNVQDREILFGENDIYLNEGMSSEFLSRPITFTSQIDRDSDVIELEEKHIELYDCDLELKESERQKNLIDSLESDTAFKKRLNNFIESKIKQLTAEELENLDLQEKINEWTALFIKFELEGNPIGYFNGYNSIQKGNRSFIPSFGNTYNTCLLSNQIVQNLITQKYGNYYPNNLLDINTVVTELPLEFGSTESPYNISITYIKITKDSSILDAYLRAEIPTTGDILSFKAEGLRFNPNGLEAGVGKLVLQTDVGVTITNVAKMVLTSGNTFVAWSCFGVEKFVLSGYIEFCEKYLLPVDSSSGDVIYEPSPEQLVRARFADFDVANLSDFYIELDMDRFAVNGAEHVLWTIQNAIIDFSDYKSPSNVDIPIEYRHSSVMEFNGKRIFDAYWRGFHLETAEAEIRAKDGGSANPISIGVDDLLIDDKGFTGRVNIQTEILSLDEANKWGWAMSINSLNLLIVQNKLREGGFGGLINVPIVKASQGDEIKEEDCFIYTCIIGGKDDFQFSISNQKEIKSDLLIGNLTIDANSSINIFGDSIATSLNGSLVLTGNDTLIGGSTSAGIGFSDLNLSNKYPHFISGNFGNFEGALKLGAFSIGAKIGLAKDSLGPVVRFQNAHLGLGLSGDSSGIAVEGSFDVSLKVEQDSKGRAIWKFGQLKMNSFSIDANISGNHIYGGLKWFRNHTIFGNGFAGGLIAEFKMFKNAGTTEITVAGTFGKTDYQSVDGEKYSYFMVDVIAAFDPGIELSGALSLTSIGGGLRYHMSTNSLNQESIYDIEPNIKYSIAKEPGTTISGIEYTPDEEAGISFSLYAGGVVRDKSVANINIELAMGFHSSESTNSGISHIRIRGDIVCLDLDFNFSSVVNAVNLPETKNFTGVNASLNPSQEAAIKGYLVLEMQFDEGFELDGKLGLFLNVGDNLVHGQALAEMHFGSDSWYFNFGRLNEGYKTNKYNADKISDAFLQANFVAFTAELQAYFNIGQDIPPMPEMPTKLQRFFPNYQRPDAGYGTGNGIAFGARYEAGYNLDFGVASAAAEILVGFDLSMKQYNNVICQKDNTPLGINNWYAMGQVYMGLGFKLKIVGITVFNGFGGAYAQCGFPNPSWIKGEIGLAYTNVWGNRKVVRAEININERCIPVGGPLQEVLDSTDLIISVVPFDGQQLVDPVYPEIYADLSFDYHYSVNYDADTKIKVVADKANSRLEGRYGRIPISFQSDPDISTKVNIITDDDYTLPTGDTLTLYLEFDVLINGEEDTTNSVIYVQGRRDTVTFITSGYQEFKLNQRNIEQSYPFAGMNHFHPAETEQGYIYFKKRNIAINIASQKLIAIWTNKATGESKATKVNYVDQGDDKFSVYFGVKSIKFDIPELDLDNEYELALIAAPDSIVENLSFEDQSETLNILEEVTGIKFGVNPDSLEFPEPAWSISFTTSKYAKFEDKATAWFENISSLNLPLDTETKSFKHTFTAIEGLDIFEYKYDAEDSVYTHGNYVQKVITDINLKGLVDVRLDYSEVYTLNGDSVIDNGINHPALADGEILDLMLVADLAEENSSSTGNDIPCLSGSSYDTTNTQNFYLSDEELWNDVISNVAGHSGEARGLPRINKFDLELVGVNKRSQVDYCIQFSSKDDFYPPFGETDINDTTNATNDVPQEITLHIAYFQAIEDAFFQALDNAVAFKYQKDNCENNNTGGLQSPGGSNNMQALLLNTPGGSGNGSICKSEDGEFITLIEDLSCIKQKITSGDEIHNRYYSSISGMKNRSQLEIPLVVTYSLPNGYVTSRYSKNITIYKQ